VASFLWTLCISIFIFRSTPEPIKTFCATHITFHVVCWCIPLTLCVVVVANGRAGQSRFEPGDVHNTGGWCWLNTTDLNGDQLLMWELIGGKAVEIFCIVTVCILYFLTARKFRANDMHELQQSLLLDMPVRRNVEEFQRKLVLVPVFFVFARLWGSINTFLYAFNPADKDLLLFKEVLDYLQAFCDPIQGFLNAVLFVAFSVEVRTLISRSCVMLCRRKPRSIDSGRPSMSGVPDNVHHVSDHLRSGLSDLSDDVSVSSDSPSGSVSGIDEGRGDQLR
jgi:hypothetical protein